MPTTILVGLDGSALADAALALAAQLAAGTGAALTLVTVVETRAAPGPVNADACTWTMRTQASARQALERSAESIPGGAVARLVVRHGDVPDELIAEATAVEGPALLVIGSRGVGGIRARLLGAVSRRLFESSPVPLLIVTTPVEANAAPTVLRRVLVPLDGRQPALGALPVAERLAKPAGATLTLLNVEVVGWAHAPVDPAAMDNVLAELVADRRAMLLRAAAAVNPAVPVEVLVTWSTSVGSSIIETAVSRGCDLIVIGSPGNQRLRHALLGSVTRHLLIHSPMPVLVVHEPLGRAPSAPSWAADASSADPIASGRSR